MWMKSIRSISSPIRATEKKKKESLDPEKMFEKFDEEMEIEPIDMNITIDDDDD